MYVSFVLLMKVFFTMFPVAVAVIPSIGKCNLTQFTAGGQLCQRTMVENLKEDSATNCSLEHSKQRSCLTTHVDKCLSDLKSTVTDLLELLLFHCGNLKIDPATVNPFILSQIKCKAEVFTNTLTCWEDFRTRLLYNRSDPLLCNDYATAKECVIKEAKHGCQIGQYIYKDDYNPFCLGNLDPLLIPPASTDVSPTYHLGKCIHMKFVSGAYDCQRIFISTLVNQNYHHCSLDYSKAQSCLQYHVSSCFYGTILSSFSDDAATLLQMVLYHCGDLSGDISMVDPVLLQMLNCQTQDFRKTVKCWDEFRLRLENDRSDPYLCMDFARAKDCVSQSVTSICAIFKFMVKDSWNIFCPRGRDPPFIPPKEPARLVCESEYYFQNAISCERHFIKRIIARNDEDSCRSNTSTIQECISERMKVCYAPYVDYYQLPMLVKTLMLLLQGPQLLCNQISKTLDRKSVPFSVRQVASCNNLYNLKVSWCAEKLLNMFEVVPSSHCKDYKISKACIDDARRSHCSVGVGGLKILNDDYNPFCKNENNPPDHQMGAANSMRMCHVIYVALQVLCMLLID